MISKKKSSARSNYMAASCQAPARQPINAHGNVAQAHKSFCQATIGQIKKKEICHLLGKT
jgi:hypothetical protein